LTASTGLDSPKRQISVRRAPSRPALLLGHYLGLTLGMAALGGVLQAGGVPDGAVAASVVGALIGTIVWAGLYGWRRLRAWRKRIVSRGVELQSGDPTEQRQTFTKVDDGATTTLWIHGKGPNTRMFRSNPVISVKRSGGGSAVPESLTIPARVYALEVTGDAIFDSAIAELGSGGDSGEAPEWVIAACLDQGTRGRIDRLRRAFGLWVAEGGISLPLQHTARSYRKAQIDEYLDELEHLLDRLSVDVASAPERILANLAKERNLGVVSFMARALYELAPEQAQRAKKLLYERGAGFRAAAIEAAGAEGLEEAFEFVRDTGDAGPRSSLRARLLERIFRIADQEILRERGGELEALLIDLLDDDDDRARVRAARLLGAHGTVQAVEPLLAERELLFDGDYRRAADSAVARIQSRIEGAHAGQLTVAEPEASGSLSLTEGAEGSLALEELVVDEDG